MSLLSINLILFDAAAVYDRAIPEVLGHRVVLRHDLKSNMLVHAEQRQDSLRRASMCLAKQRTELAKALGCSPADGALFAKHQLIEMGGKSNALLKTWPCYLSFMYNSSTTEH